MKAGDSLIFLFPVIYASKSLSSVMFLSDTGTLKSARSNKFTWLSACLVWCVIDIWWCIFYREETAHTACLDHIANWASWCPSAKTFECSFWWIKMSMLLNGPFIHNVKGFVFLPLIFQAGRNRGEVQEQGEPSWGSADHRWVEGHGVWERSSCQETGGR